MVEFALATLILAGCQESPITGPNEAADYIARETMETDEPTKSPLKTSQLDKRSHLAFWSHTRSRLVIAGTNTDADLRCFDPVGQLRKGYASSPKMATHRLPSAS